jgi:hypothetical protein
METMLDMRSVIRLALLGSTLLALACSSPPEPGPKLLAPTEEQMKLRSYQTRTFEIQDKNRAIRGVMAALQDLGFIIERANEPLGLVTAARFEAPEYYDIIAVTVTVRPQAGGQMMIRANAIYNNAPIEDPEAYQNFFATLQRALFLGAP